MKRCKAQTVRVGVVADVMDYAPFWYAESRNIFDARGLILERVVTGSVVGAVGGLRTGRFHVAVSASEAVLAQASPTSELVILGGTTQRLMLALIGSADVRTIGDLTGATLGASAASEGTALLMLEMLRAAGVDTDTVRIEPIGVGSVRLEALVAGRIQAGIINIPVSYEAVERGLSLLGFVADVVPHYQFVTINARRRWVEDKHNSDVLIRLLAGLAEAVEEVYRVDNRDLMVNLVAQKMRVSAASAERGWADYLRIRPNDATLRLSPAGIEKTLSTMRLAGTVDQNYQVHLSDVYYPGFLPTSR